METIHIAEITPELSAHASKQFRAAVTLIWPYSSSQREFALLLAEPEFRLRRKKGQVRARFTGSSAKALATTGVGIGDEVVLRLRGAQFLKEGTVSTPGRSIDWELEYAQTLVVQVFRAGNEIASLDLVDAAPTPVPRSPVRRVPAAAPSPAPQWSSPAFLKRARLSDGPFFEAPYDPLADENADGHDKKRRRKSYRDWKTWTYSVRTPSPDKEDVGVEDTFGVEASPSRPTKLPHTPVSPPKPDLSVAAGQLDGARDLQAEQANAVPAEYGSKQSPTPIVDDFVRDSDYYNLYAGPDEVAPAQAQFAFGGDTEANTEEEDAQDNAEEASFSTTEANTDIIEEHRLELLQPLDAGSETEEDSVLEVVEPNQQGPSRHTSSRPLADSAPSAVVMPPPLVSAPTTSDMLSAPGKEPASPTLQPLDSALLPLISPFPVHNKTSTSYFDHAPASLASEGPETAEQEPTSDADYVLENSFFSSIASSKNPAVHPDHESAFAPLRFTFGMDSASMSRPLDLSSPAPEAVKLAGMNKDTGVRSASPGEMHTIPETFVSDTRLSSSTRPSQSQNTQEAEVIDLLSDSEEEEPDEEGVDVAEAFDVPEDHGRPELNDPAMDIFHFSSEPDVQSEMRVKTSDRQEQAGLDVGAPTSTIQSTGASEIVDLGSPSSEIEEEEADTAADEDTRATVDLPGEKPYTSTSGQGLITADNRHSSEFTAMDFAHEISAATTNTREEAPAHTSAPQEPEAACEASIFDDYEPQLGMDDLDTFMPDEVPGDAAEHHPDVKLESIEDSALHLISSDAYDAHGGLAKGVVGPSAEILIEVPEDGHKVGETHTIAVPATGPARNTRSKTKPSMSPAREEPPVPRRTTRSTRSKVSVTPSSPPRTKTRSAMSPASQTSPYILRSQSRMLSPPSPLPETRRRSPRKRALNRSIDSLSDFEPSQQFRASQGRYSDLAFIKDSEEESLHSEHSLSTVKYSDDWNTFTNFSDPVVPPAEEEDHVDMQAPSATAPELDAGMGAKTKWKKSQAQSTRHGSSPTQPRAGRTGQGESYDICSSPPPIISAFPSVNQQSVMNSNRLATPEATQHTNIESQPSFTAQQRQSLPMTPQLTQRTSMSLRSFNAPAQVDTTTMSVSPKPKPSPNVVTRSTPRRNATQTDVASPSSSPVEAHSPSPVEVHSPDLSSPDVASTLTNKPSIGLSTPIAYYTPLQQLTFFLNRPSQFHTASNPDVLALVTSGTTPAARATKGRKDWTTSLHITDLSIYPATTTVNIFRTYHTALPRADPGDVILLRACAVKSLNRSPGLVSADESSWCVWRYGKQIWGKRKGGFGEVRAREEVRGPVVERGEGEWGEVERLRAWWVREVEGGVEEGEGKRGARRREMGRGGEEEG